MKFSNVSGSSSRSILIWILYICVAISPVLARVVVIGKPYNEAEFVKAQADDKMIIIESYATWCLACRIQFPLLMELLQRPAYSKTVLFRLQENSPKAAWKKFRVKSYGYLIVYKGQRETARAAGAKTLADVESLLATAEPRV